MDNGRPDGSNNVGLNGIVDAVPPPNVDAEGVDGVDELPNPCGAYWLDAPKLNDWLSCPLNAANGFDDAANGFVDAANGFVDAPNPANGLEPNDDGGGLEGVAPKVNL